jgi:hypothetical protein
LKICSADFKGRPCLGLAFAFDVIFSKGLTRQTLTQSFFFFYFLAFWAAAVFGGRQARFPKNALLRKVTKNCLPFLTFHEKNSIKPELGFI